jgi:CDP-diglyceride synthetase
MLRWRLLIGIPLVGLLVALCWLDAIAPIPGIVLMPFFLVCVYFLCKETLWLLNAGGIYPRRSTVYLSVFGTIILCWFACYNSLPIIVRLENALATALQVQSEKPQEAPMLQEPGKQASDPEKLNQATEALIAAKQALENALDAVRGGDGNERGAEQASSEAPAEVRVSSISNEEAWKTAAYAGIHILLAIAAGVLIAFVGEMARFKQPGGNIINLMGAIFIIVYIGLLGSFMVMLRIAYGIMAVVSMIVVTKLCDIGAYTVGRLIGKHKMAPSLSPGKTIEGACGGMLFAIFGAWFSTAVLFPLASGRPSQTTWLGIIVYGVAVGAAGALGDLAESLIKRDVSRKDSGVNVPGFGGFLDIFDSLLVAAPVAFGLWAFHVIQ